MATITHKITPEPESVVATADLKVGDVVRDAQNRKRAFAGPRKGFVSAKTGVKLDTQAPEDGVWVRIGKRTKLAENSKQFAARMNALKAETKAPKAKATPKSSELDELRAQVAALTEVVSALV